MKASKLQAAVEAILFASGEPIEYERIAEALEIEPEYAENLLMNLHLAKKQKIIWQNSQLLSKTIWQLHKL